ncbi:MAG: FAD-dependent oxidoreductase [Clostridiales bacterium]|nr:FAD-dependent oxidoreductase [Clostridiales bacterium]
MKTIQETLETPVIDEYDVIVVGGGPAGVGAALGAARQGAKTLLIEQYAFLGGMWTAGMVIPIWDWENKGGIMQEIVDGLMEEKHTAYSGPLLGFDIEAMKLLLDQMMLNSNVALLFHTWFSAPIMQNNTICGVIVENKSGRQAYGAKCVIDCTGDGDVAARAGAPFKVGREKDGATQPMSLMFKMGEMDYVQAMDYSAGPLKTTDLFFHMEHAAQAAGLNNYAFNFDRPYILSLPTPHQGIAEMTHVRNKSGINAQELSEAEVEGRALVHEAMDYFTKYMPQFRHAILEQTAPCIGVRETRRIMGEYELTLDDILEGRMHEDGICTCAFSIDIHQPDGLSQEGYEYHTKPYHIPYRSLVPLKVEKLLVAGRCISGSYEAHASYRVTGDCVAMGQAAGIAAAIAVKNTIPPRNIDTRDLIQLLRNQGVNI